MHRSCVSPGTASLSPPSQQHPPCFGDSGEEGGPRCSLQSGPSSPRLTPAPLPNHPQKPVFPPCCHWASRTFSMPPLHGLRAALLPTTSLRGPRGSSWSTLVLKDLSPSVPAPWDSVGRTGLSSGGRFAPCPQPCAGDNRVIALWQQEGLGRPSWVLKMPQATTTHHPPPTMQRLCDSLRTAKSHLSVFFIRDVNSFYGADKLFLRVSCASPQAQSPGGSPPRAEEGGRVSTRRGALPPPLRQAAHGLATPSQPALIPECVGGGGPASVISVANSDFLSPGFFIIKYFIQSFS